MIQMEDTEKLLLLEDQGDNKFSNGFESITRHQFTQTPTRLSFPYSRYP